MESFSLKKVSLTSGFRPNLRIEWRDFSVGSLLGQGEVVVGVYSGSILSGESKVVVCSSRDIINCSLRCPLAQTCPNPYGSTIGRSNKDSIPENDVDGFLRVDAIATRTASS